MKNIDTSSIPFCNYQKEAEDWAQLLLDNSPDCFDWTLAKNAVSVINVLIDGEFIGTTEIPQSSYELAPHLYDNIRRIKHDIAHHTKNRYKLVSLKMNANDEDPQFSLYFITQAIVVFEKPAIQEITFDISVDYNNEV